MDEIYMDDIVCEHIHRQSLNSTFTRWDCFYQQRNINGSVQKFYCKVNSVLYDFKDIPCDVKTRLLDTYFLDLYGSELWNYSKHDVNHFYVAWRKTIRRLWKIPNTLQLIIVDQLV